MSNTAKNLQFVTKKGIPPPPATNYVVKFDSQQLIYGQTPFVKASISYFDNKLHMSVANYSNVGAHTFTIDNNNTPSNFIKYSGIPFNTFNLLWSKTTSSGVRVSITDGGAIIKTEGTSVIYSRYIPFGEFSSTSTQFSLGGDYTKQIAADTDSTGTYLNFLYSIYRDTAPSTPCVYYSINTSGTSAQGFHKRYLYQTSTSSDYPLALYVNKNNDRTYLLLGSSTTTEKLVVSVINSTSLLSSTPSYTIPTGYYAKLGAIYAGSVILSSGVPGFANGMYICSILSSTDNTSRRVCIIKEESTIQWQKYLTIDGASTFSNPYDTTSIFDSYIGIHQNTSGSEVTFILSINGITQGVVLSGIDGSFIRAVGFNWISGDGSKNTSTTKIVDSCDIDGVNIGLALQNNDSPATFIKYPVACDTYFEEPGVYSTGTSSDILIALASSSTQYSKPSYYFNGVTASSLGRALLTMQTSTGTVSDIVNGNTVTATTYTTDCTIISI